MTEHSMSMSADLQSSSVLDIVGRHSCLDIHGA